MAVATGRQAAFFHAQHKDSTRQVAPKFLDYVCLRGFPQFHTTHHNNKALKI
jgi:hypothetical protein